MGKKRSCRRSVNENAIHDKAVKLRKMTDEQLVHYVEDRVAKAYSEGSNATKKSSPQIDISKIVEEIGSVKGIGTTKLAEIETILKANLEV